MGNTLTISKKDVLVALLTEFKKVFAWSYEDMPGINTDIVHHYIPTDPITKPVKQKLRRMKPEWTLRIKEEVEKQYNTGFLREVNYPEWLANVVSVPKKDVSKFYPSRHEDTRINLPTRSHWQLTSVLHI